MELKIGIWHGPFAILDWMCGLCLNLMCVSRGRFRLSQGFDCRAQEYVIGDPLEGKIVRSQAELRDAYVFTGFFMSVK